MSALDVAWFAVAIALILMIGVLCWVLAHVSRVLASVKDLLDGVTRQTVPLLGEVNTTVNLVNHELGRVDGILANAENVSSTAGHLVNVVSETVTSPLVKLSAFAWGLRRAVGAATDGDEASAGRGTGRGRRGRR